MSVYQFCKQCKTRKEAISANGPQCSDKQGHRKYGAYRVDVQTASARIREVFDRKEDALEFESKIEAEIRENKYFGKSLSKNLIFSDLVDRYKNDHVAVNNRNPEKNTFYKLDLIKEYLGTQRVSEMSRESLLAFQKDILKGHLANSTSNRLMRIVKAIFNKAMEWDLIKENPAEYVPYLIEEDPTPRFLSKSEISRLWQHCHSKELRDYVTILLHTGARPSSLLECKWSDVDFNQRVIWFTTYKGNRSKPHRYPLHIDDQLLIILKERLDTQGQVFPIGVQLERAARRAIKESGINLGKPFNQRFTIYGLKHCFASHHLMQGTSLDEVRLMLGHTDDKMVRKHYSHLTLEHLKKIQEKVNLTEHLIAPIHRQNSDTTFENDCPQADLNRCFGLERAKLSLICNTKDNLN